MRLRLKVKEERTLSNIYTIAKKSLLSRKALGAMVVVLGLYTVFDVFYAARPITPATSDREFPSNNVSDSVSEALRMDLQEYYHEKPVKIYVYDLPHRFTYGIIEYHYMSHTNNRAKDVTNLAYPAHQHMAEWFLFKDLLLPSHERGRSPVARVNSPEEADLFYVPFFSSLSMIATRLRGPEAGGPPKYNDEATQLALVEWLEGKESWRRNKGRDHVIVASDPNAYHKVIDKVKNCVMLVAGFGRLREDQGSLVKDVVAPYMHRVSSYNGDVGVENRNTLLFFMGARYRKEGGKIRDLLFEILENEEDVVMKQGVQSREDRRSASNGMHTSKFCLNPAGDTSTSCRLFDSIVSLCVPVIVSDDIELPFEDAIDYTKIAIFVASDEALKPGALAAMLRAMPDERIIQYQQELKEVKPYFDFRSETLNQIWREVTYKLPFIKLMINREKRMVNNMSMDDLVTPPDCSCLCSNQTEI